MGRAKTERERESEKRDEREREREREREISWIYQQSICKVSVFATVKHQIFNSVEFFIG